MLEDDYSELGEDGGAAAMEELGSAKEEAALREASFAEAFFRGLCEDREDVYFLREYFAQRLRQGIKGGDIERYDTEHKALETLLDFEEVRGRAEEGSCATCFDVFENEFYNILLLIEQLKTIEGEDETTTLTFSLVSTKRRQ